MVAKRNNSSPIPTPPGDRFSTADVTPADTARQQREARMALLEMQAEAFIHLEEEIFTALQTPHPRMELAKIARWNQVGIEIIEQVAQSVLKRRTGQDLERLEFDSVMRQIKQLELEERDPGFREWKLQALARQLKRTPRQLLDAYNKALCQQASIQPLSVAEFRSQQQAEIQWLIHGWIPKGTTLLLHAEGGIGKTLFAYQLLEAVLSGSPWNGYQVQQCPALMVQVDEPSLVTGERIDIRGIRDDAPLQILSDWQVEQMAELERLIEQQRPGFVLIDSLTAINRHCVFSENDTEYARPVLQLAAIGSKYGCTVVIIHHSNGEGKARGSKAIHNSVSEVWSLTADGPAFRLLRVQKTRMGRPPGTYRFKFQDDDFSFVYVGEDGQADEGAAATQEERIRLWLSEADRRGIHYTVAEISELIQMSRHCARRACYELWAKGLVKRTRPKGQQSYLYYLPRESATEPVDQQVITDRPMITCDHSEVITVPSNEGKDLRHTRSRDHRKSENFNVKKSENQGSRDHVCLKPSPGRQLNVITTGDHSGDHDDHMDDRDHLSADDHPIGKGDTVLPLASATLYRSGSCNIPAREIASGLKRSAEIPLQNCSSTLLEELLAPAIVVDVSADGARCKTRNTQTGNSYVFNTSGLRLFKKGKG